MNRLVTAKMKKDRYALFGDPVELSPSPQIHQSFAESLNHQINYEKSKITKQQFNEAVSSFFKKGGKGLNITVPHKQAAYFLTDVNSASAEQAKAVNTLWMKDGLLHGDNTDGIGFINDCLAREIVMQNKSILILGAGGAVRGILAPLLEQNPAQIIIANRSLDKAQHLVSDFTLLGRLSTTEINQIPKQRFDLVINGLSLNDIPDGVEISLHKNASYYDLKYGQAAQSSIDWAVENSFEKVVDGWGMLLRQAAQSYFIWRHQIPSVNELIQNPLLISK